MKCSTCGGQRTNEKCNVCELLSSGQSYNGVETCRQNKPNESLALKVHPSQVKEAIENSRLKGCPTEFKKDGTPVFESRGHKKRYCKAYGFHNLDAGYGD